jgi:hypothetical protein
MACFPKIDQPCPLGIDAQRRIRGHCAHCSKHVQSLDGMDGAARAAYLRAATGPVCVSYRVPRAAILGLGAVLVLSSVAPGHAADPVGAGVAVDVPAAPVEPGKNDEPVMLMGGVTDPSAAADAMEADDDVPELPVVHEPADG